jgi:hypothetical protein
VKNIFTTSMPSVSTTEIDEKCQGIDLNGKSAGEAGTERHGNNV